MKTKDPAEKMSELVVDAYKYALDHNLDISNKVDVSTILKTLDPNHSSENDVEAFMPILEFFDRKTKADVAKRKNSEKTELQN